jgi:acetyl-CoA C-acetyltransferase
MSSSKSYIIAARRVANGRLGGLHRNRRVEDLAAPVVIRALADVGIEPDRVDLLILGNTLAGGNPARLVALIAGLPDRAATLSIDRHTASGLEAILAATRTIACGEAEIAVAGGADSFSTAPWRIAKPRTIFHMPRFLGLNQVDDGERGDLSAIEAMESCATRLGLSRSQQDEYALACHIKAGLARTAEGFVREIVAIKSKPEEARDELVGEPDIDDMESYPAFHGEGTLTAGNTSLPADGAAIVVAVSERIWRDLGAPPAIRIAASVSFGVSPEIENEAPLIAIRRLAERTRLETLSGVAAIAFAETSAVQALAVQAGLGEASSRLNSDGGQLARGQPGGAASAVVVTRLFTDLVRDDRARSGSRAIAAAGASGGQTIAALLERV